MTYTAEQRARAQRLRYVIALDQLTWFEAAQVAYLDYAAGQRSYWRGHLSLVLLRDQLRSYWA